MDLYYSEDNKLQGKQVYIGKHFYTLAAEASLAPEPACSTWRMSTDPAARSRLDTSTSGTNGSRDTSGSRADSHNANSSNPSFSGD